MRRILSPVRLPIPTLRPGRRYHSNRFRSRSIEAHSHDVSSKIFKSHNTFEAKLGIHRYWVLLVISSCLPCLAQITGTLTAAATGKPIDHGLVMGEGFNLAYSNQDGQCYLPKARFRGPNAPAQVPVTFRAEGYRPLTRIAESENAVLDVRLGRALASDWTIS